MKNDISILQAKYGASLKNTYLKRLEEIKELIAQAAGNGQDTYFLRRIKRNLKNCLTNFEADFLLAGHELITDSYYLAVTTQEQNRKKLNYPILAASYVIDSGIIKEYEQLLNNPLKIIKHNVSNKLDDFIKTDFKNPKAVLKQFNKLTGLRIKKTNPKDLQKVIESTLKGKDLFKIPYYSKDHKVIRHVSVESYSSMLARTISANTYRDSVKDYVLKMFSDYGDLVEVVGSVVCKCDVCADYYGKFLSLSGLTKGYTTLEEARKKGLFHPNCNHWFNVTRKVIKQYKTK